MYVAMKDLEIRGAGNLLGGEQSGHIEGVGFDLYVRMVGEAVAQFKGEQPEEDAEVKVDLPVDAHLPQEYISVERLRLEAYRKLAAATDDAELDEVVAEMTDRYGEPPQPVRNLRRGGQVPVAGPRLRADRRVAAGPAHPVRPAADLPDSKQLRLKRYYPDAVYKRPCAPCRCPARPPAVSAASRCVISPCWTGAPRCYATFSASPCPSVRPEPSGRAATRRRGWRNDRCLAVRE